MSLTPARAAPYHGRCAKGRGSLATSSSSAGWLKRRAPLHGHPTQLIVHLRESLMHEKKACRDANAVGERGSRPCKFNYHVRLVFCSERPPAPRPGIFISRLLSRFGYDLHLLLGVGLNHLHGEFNHATFVHRDFFRHDDLAGSFSLDIDGKFDHAGCQWRICRSGLCGLLRLAIRILWRHLWLGGCVKPTRGPRLSICQMRGMVDLGNLQCGQVEANRLVLWSCRRP